jgi:hypothetical protein
MLNTNLRGATEDDLPTPAGFFSKDCDSGYGDVLPRRIPSPHLLDNNATIEKIFIAVDFGTENSAVTYELHWEGQNDQPQPGKDTILPYIKPVMFFNGSYVKTQIGWHSKTHKMLYGDEVDDAIGRGMLLQGSHVRGLKLAFLDPSGQIQTERTRLENQLKALPREIRLVKDESGSRRRQRELTLEDLVSEFMGYLVRYCLYKICIARAHAGLPWPRWDSRKAFRDLDPTIVSKVVVYIAVPSLSTAEFVDLVVSATKRAGFPEAVVAPEPACAQQLLLQIEFETSRERRGNFYHGASIILDVGGGTADLQTLSIVKYNPTEIREEVLGDGRQLIPYTIGLPETKQKHPLQVGFSAAGMSIRSSDSTPRKKLGI